MMRWHVSVHGGVDRAWLAYGPPQRVELLPASLTGAEPSSSAHLHTGGDMQAIVCFEGAPKVAEAWHMTSHTIPPCPTAAGAATAAPAAVSGLLRVIMHAIQYTCGKPPTESVMFEKYARICAVVDEVINEVCACLGMGEGGGRGGTGAQHLAALPSIAQC